MIHYEYEYHRRGAKRNALTFGGLRVGRGRLLRRGGLDVGLLRAAGDRLLRRQQHVPPAWTRGCRGHDAEVNEGRGESISSVSLQACSRPP